MTLILFAEGWIRTYGYEPVQKANCVQQTADGGYIMVGYKVLRITEPDAESELWLVKTDENGDTLWTKTYGAPYRGDGGEWARQTSDGGYIITGYTNNNDGDYFGTGDVWLLKTDAKGDTQWTQNYKGKYGVGKWVEQTTDGGYIITGLYQLKCIWLIKTDKNGDTLWTRKWGTAGARGYCVHQTWDGGYIVATDLGLLKTNSKGDSMWLKPWVGKSINPTKDYGYILASIRDENIWLVKTDWMGDTLWTKTYSKDSFLTWATYAQQTTDDAYIILGACSGVGIWLVRTNPLGDTMWTRTYKGMGSSIQQTTDGGFIIGGTVDSLTEPGCSYFMLIKTDSLGYVGIAEPVIPPAQTNWQVVSPIGPAVTLQYSNLPQGFHALVFDASGRKVDEIKSSQTEGTIQWGMDKNPGVYFVKEKNNQATTLKVILIR